MPRTKSNFKFVSSVRSNFFIGGLIICLLNASCSVANNNSASAPPTAPPPAVVSELQEICRNLPTIPDATAGENNEILQANKVVYKTIYESEAMPDKVEPLFVESLTAKGWQSSVERTTETTTVNFRKSDFTVAVEYYNHQYFSSQQYTVNCVWERSAIEK